MKNAKTTSKTAATKTSTDKTAETAKPRKRRATPTGVTVTLPRTPGHHYGSHRHHNELQTGDVVYVGTTQKLLQLEVIDSAKAPTEIPELGAGKFVAIRTVADELDVDGTTVKNAEVILYCTPDSRIAIKTRY